MVYRFKLTVFILNYSLLVHRSTVGFYNWACTLKQFYTHLLTLMVLLLCALSNLHTYITYHNSVIIDMLLPLQELSIYLNKTV